MHHKRKRPRNRRAGCKQCKYWKLNGIMLRCRWKASELRRLQDDPMYGR
jgi:hypothetical protein